MTTFGTTLVQKPKIACRSFLQWELTLIIFVSESHIATLAGRHNSTNDGERSLKASMDHGKLKQIILLNIFSWFVLPYHRELALFMACIRQSWWRWRGNDLWYAAYCENARNLLKSRVDSSGKAQEFPHGSRRADVYEASGEWYWFWSYMTRS